MKIVENIKEILAVKLLKSKASKLSRYKTFHNFDSAQTIGILFDATQQNKYLSAKAFMGYLKEKGIEVQGLGYVADKKMIGYFPYKRGVEYFSIDNLTFLKKPVNEQVNKFIRKKFDILIDLSIDEIFPVQYILGMSNAKFKISRDFSMNFSDFVLKASKQVSIDDYIEQLKHYMSALSKN